MKNFFNKIKFSISRYLIYVIVGAFFTTPFTFISGCSTAKKVSEQEISLQYFKAVGICDIAQIKKLREAHNIDINFVNVDQVNGLMLSSYKGNDECVKYFLEENIDLSAKDINFRGALFYSIEGKKNEISKLLIEKGIETNSVDKFNLTPLMIAAKLGQPEVVSEIVKKGAKLDQADENGWSALFFAVSAKQKEIVKFLVESGASFSMVDSDGKSPRDLAYEDLSFDISDYLEEVTKTKEVNIKKSKSKNIQINKLGTK